MFDLMDAHVHLQHPLLSRDIEGVFRRAKAAGVKRLACNGTEPRDWPRVLALAEEHPEVVPFFGLHPWYVPEAREDWARVLEGFLDKRASGVGETGLDATKGDAAAQEAAFRTQLGMARERRLPIVVHCVRAWGRLMDLLRGEGPLPGGMLLHAYSGPAELLAPLAKLGAYFSFAGFTLEDRRKKVLESLRAAPLDRLLLETDAPDPKYGGEPSELPAVLSRAAVLRGMKEPELARIVWENAARAFGRLW
ncbi:MAG: TatD family hydrolase [Elusimicrobiota bacterium]